MTPDDLLQIRTIGQNAHTVTGARQDYQPLMELIGDSRFVLLGEASHGTHDFYYTRAQITEWLIEEKGFGAIAVEADWPDAHRVNRYVQDRSDDASAVEALASFQRFPSWMWRNADVVEFVEWLRDYNDGFGNVRGKSVSMVLTFTVCMLPLALSSNSWTRSIRKLPGVLAIAMHVSNTSGRTLRPTDMRLLLT
jgi:hypothetical protein